MIERVQRGDELQTRSLYGVILASQFQVGMKAEHVCPCRSQSDILPMGSIRDG